VNPAVSSDLDYFVGTFLVMVPDLLIGLVLCAIGLLVIDPYFDWSKRLLAKLSGVSGWLFLIAVILVPWFIWVLFILYFIVHSFVVEISFVPTYLAEAERFRPGTQLFPLHGYSKYTLYFLERKSELTLGPTFDTLMKGLTPSGTSLLFGGGDMRFSVASARVEELWGALGRDPFMGAVIKAVFALVNFVATLGSFWGFFALLHKARRRWSRSLRQG